MNRIRDIIPLWRLERARERLKRLAAGAERRCPHDPAVASLHPLRAWLSRGGVRNDAGHDLLPPGGVGLLHPRRRWIRSAVAGQVRLVPSRRAMELPCQASQRGAASSLRVVYL